MPSSRPNKMDSSIAQEVTENQEGSSIPRKKSRGPRWTFPISIGLVGLVIIGGLTVAFPKQIKYQLQISLFRQNTPYTQLFFTNQATLSSRLRVGDENEFSFTVVNDQGHSRNYQYTVTMDGAGRQQLVTQGVFAVKNGGTLNRNVLFEPKFHKTKYMITVELNGLDLSIHYYGVTS
jgi:hypothetical protein